ncbi:MAG: hypothetical protein JHC26_12095 [Thermofilum sp.]|jgi:hypothetical protein|uniref:hypothetical protein n=1 Tax=Thermofilum sp. TaxID=1961369 RepID=UPI0025833759|nr:hypothetical protein [Thermofilum sp.]MCI4409826.1 hypothetical protein [Thermofilum sp.]
MNKDEFIDDFILHPEKYKYKVVWYVNVVKIRGKKHSVGYCTYGKGVAFITRDILTPLVVDHVTVQPPLDDGTPGYCSDSKWCLNTRCSLNRSGEPGVDLSSLERALDDVDKLFNIDRERCERCVFDKPPLKAEPVKKK